MKQKTEKEKYDEMRLFFRFRSSTLSESENTIYDMIEEQFKKIYGDAYK